MTRFFDEEIRDCLELSEGEFYCWSFDDKNWHVNGHIDLQDVMAEALNQRAEHDFCVFIGVAEPLPMAEFYPNALDLLIPDWNGDGNMLACLPNAGREAALEALSSRLQACLDQWCEEFGVRSNLYEVWCCDALDFEAEVFGNPYWAPAIKKQGELQDA